MPRPTHIKAEQRAPWYEIKASAKASTAEVWIYEEIDEWWGVSAAAFVQELAALDVESINLHINSPGGSVFEGVAIFNALRNHKASVTTYIDGWAASIASVVALAGDKVVMAPNAMFMIHDPWGVARGGAEDMRKMADVLDKIRDTIASTYIAKTGMEAEDVHAAMSEETWYSAEEALEAGFVDELGPEMAAAASAQFDFKAFGYRHAPEAPAAAAQPDAPAAAPADAGDTAPTMVAEAESVVSEEDAAKVAQALRARFEEV